MIICPDCGHSNIPGVDICEQCQQPLSSLSKPSPSSQVERHISSDRIELLAPRQPLSVTADTPIGDVLKILVNHRIGCVVVEEEGRPIGIFTERDALMQLNVSAAQLATRPVSEFMTPEPKTLKASDKIAFALHRMDLGGFRHIPLMKDDKAVGIISIRDILKYISSRLVASTT